MSTPEERRGLLFATVSNAADTGPIETISGERLQGCVSTTELGLGYRDCSFQLLMPGGSAEWPRPRAEETARLWCEAPAVFRLYARGESVWVGRCWQARMGQHREGPLGPVCTLRISCVGPALSELDNEPASVDPAMTGEGKSATLAQLVKDQVAKSSGLVRAIDAQITDTGTDIGPVEVGPNDTPLSLIGNYTKVGDGADHEMALLIYEPEDGPILKPLDDGTTRQRPRWALDINGSNAETVIGGDARANTAIVTYTDSTGTSEALDPITDSAALVRQGGIRRILSLVSDGAGRAGAEAAGRAALALKADPRAVDGSFLFGPEADGLHGWATNAEGGREPHWRPRAGDLARVVGAWQSDPTLHDSPDGYVAFIQSTSTDWDAGATTVQLDRRRIRLRPHEDRRELRRWRRLLEPGRAFGLRRAGFHVVNQTIPPNTTVKLKPELVLHPDRPADLDIDLSFEASLSAAAATTIKYGYTIDSEAWDPDSRALARWHETPASGAGTPFTVHTSFSREVGPGWRRVSFWARHTHGTGTITVVSCSGRARN